MEFGVHISGAGGLEHIPAKAKKLGCGTFQFFSHSPRGGKSVLEKETADAFANAVKELGFSRYYIHAPYYVNLASRDARIYNGSVEILRDELARAARLNARGVITHLGTANGMERKEALERVIAAGAAIVANAPSTLYLEISAGAGEIIGATLDELHEIHSNILKNIGMESDTSPLKIALDTAHCFASGYDIRAAKGLAEMLTVFDRLFGLMRLDVIHVNDSKVGLGEHKDRHEHIGKGMLGLEAFRLLVNEQRLSHADMILETPKDSDEDDLLNLAVLRQIKNK